ncbi:hypothetical protein CC80DRAFT_597428 [Byssothecium circinans]|uniref:F-box domain-containing protein n=1 Tax=Byssothecium circinans TaxID=147558 RepID=A0A6A5TH83_9PLEO|nr:hypothetical protein CC80DRAFT_597428 [Byssothecium circinans]
MAPPKLDTLPPEILFNILSYTTPLSTALLPKHPLLATAATSKHLCGVVEEYCRGLLKRHANISPPKAPKTGAFVCRRKWFKWLRETCQVCGRASVRKAILDAGLTCCKRCDDKNFPKMTQTHAIQHHGLSKLDLFTPNALHPTLPPLSLGTYMVGPSETLMISERSVLDRKAHIRSLLSEENRDDATYLRRRAAAHGRIILHMDLVYTVFFCKGRWVKAHRFRGEGGKKKMRCKSLETEEGRERYVRQGLEKEWRTMGLWEGRSVETPIEIED